jgi:hypothetical protein
MYICVCVRACVCACMRECACICVCACVCVCVFSFLYLTLQLIGLISRNGFGVSAPNSPEFFYYYAHEEECISCQRSWIYASACIYYTHICIHMFIFFFIIMHTKNAYHASGVGYI